MRYLYLFFALFLCFSVFAAENTVDVEQNIQLQFLNDHEIVETIKIPQLYLNVSQTLKEQQEGLPENQNILAIPTNQLSSENFKSIYAFFPHLLSNNQDQLKQHLEQKSDRALGTITQTADYLAVKPVFEKSLEIIADRIWNNLEKYFKEYSSDQDSFGISDNRTLCPYLIQSLIKKIKPLSYKEYATLKGLADSFRSVAFSPDGNYLAFGLWDKTIKLWDLKTNTCMHTFDGHTDIVYSVAFSPDGNYLASGSLDNTIKLWNLKTNTCIHTFAGHTDSARSVAFSPDGNYLASGSWDKTIKLWNLKTNACIHTFSGHTDSVFSVAFSPDGNYLASGSWDKTIKLWNLKTNACIHTFSDHTDPVFSVAFSSDGNHLASGSGDKTIKLWDLKTNACIHTFSDHTGYVYSVVFSPDGNYLASGAWDNMIKLWNLKTNTCMHTFHGQTVTVSSVAFSPDGNYLAGSRYHTIELWKYHSNLIDTIETLPQAIIISHLIKNISKREWKNLPQNILNHLSSGQKNIINSSSWWQKPLSIASVTTLVLGTTYLLYKWMKK